MSRLDLAWLREGDVIEVHQTLQVTEASAGYVQAKDVQSGHLYGYIPQDVDGSRSTRKLTMVKRAVRKPKVGDVLTGCEIKAIQWKRGTVFQGVDSGLTHMLNKDGKLACASGGDMPIEFINQTNTFKLLHVA